jgi:hypothetical protein
MMINKSGKRDFSISTPHLKRKLPSPILPTASEQVYYFDGDPDPSFKTVVMGSVLVVTVGLKPETKKSLD